MPVTTRDSDRQVKVCTAAKPASANAAQSMANVMRKFLILACITLIACDRPPDEAASAPIVTDSSGVHVVQYPESYARNSNIALTEVLRIGAVNGPAELLFSDIAGGRILEDGNVVLVDSASREVRLFGYDGSLLRSQGGEGQGPGEFEYIRGLGSCEEMGFTVFDLNWSMSNYDEAGEFLDERVIRFEDGSSPYHLACHSSGILAVIGWGSAVRSRVGFFAAVAPLRVLDADGLVVADLGERIVSERFGNTFGNRPHPAGRGTKFGFQGSDLVVADGSFFGFERWDPDGHLLDIVRIELKPPDIDSLMAEHLKSLLTLEDDKRARTSLRREITQMEGPPHGSFLSDLFVSDERVLIRELDMGQSGRWFAFSEDGTPIGYLPLPRGSKLLDVRGDLFLVEERNELDVPSAVLYMAKRSSGGK